MKNKTIYTDEPMKYRIIKDFLPKPEDIDFSDEKVRIVPDSMVKTKGLVIKVTKRKSVISRSKRNYGIIVVD